MTLLTIYVPAGEDTLGIKPGSGIVGSSEPTSSSIVQGLAAAMDRVRIDYEGNLHGAVNIVTWEDRVKHAAGRHVWNEGRGYPTVARRWVEPEKLHAVGTYDTDTWSIVEITDLAAVAAWDAQYREGR
ncbi:MAG TPA: hypothetical protein VGJ60_07265 [Chloroflexota bacterium]|jgi:hypothetical protein